MNKINVVNKKDHAPTDRDFYIGRGSVFGNPFTSKSLNDTKAEHQVASKEEAIGEYSAYLETRIKLNEKGVVDGINNMLLNLKEGDINLVCYCAPNPCHGVVIKNKLLTILMKDIMPK
jgi:hypothetical protein